MPIPQTHISHTRTHAQHRYVLIECMAELPYSARAPEAPHLLALAVDLGVRDAIALLAQIDPSNTRLAVTAAPASVGLPESEALLSPSPAPPPSGSQNEEISKSTNSTFLSGTYAPASLLDLHRLALRRAPRLALAALRHACNLNYPPALRVLAQYERRGLLDESGEAYVVTVDKAAGWRRLVSAADLGDVIALVR